MIEENFRVLLTKYIRIAADVFMNRVFKGNTVTDRDSAPYRTSISTQFTVRRKPNSAKVCQGHSQNIASHLHGFRHAGSQAVSLVGEGGMPLSHHGPPVNSSEYPKYLSSIVSQH